MTSRSAAGSARYAGMESSTMGAGRDCRLFLAAALFLLLLVPAPAASAVNAVELRLQEDDRTYSVGEDVTFLVRVSSGAANSTFQIVIERDGDVLGLVAGVAQNLAWTTAQWRVPDIDPSTLLATVRTDFGAEASVEFDTQRPDAVENQLAVLIGFPISIPTESIYVIAYAATAVGALVVALRFALPPALAQTIERRRRDGQAAMEPILRRVLEEFRK